MKRRKFVQTTLSALPYFALATALSSCDDEEVPQLMTDKRILIIGAGMAGLAAASYFKNRGLNVVVLEAQDKVGGRLKTNRSLSIPFDEGASWIHGPTGNPITAIANAAGANTCETDDENVEIYDIDGTRYPDDEFDPAEEMYNDILANFSGAVNQPFAEAFYAQYPQYENDRLWTYFLSTYLEFDTGGDMAELSSLDFYDDEAFRGDDLIITNGFDTIAEHLATELDIRLNTPVTEIDYADERIKVVTDTEDFDADFILVTVPLGVLKADVITFTPPLSGGVEEAINNLNMGSVNKFLCVWDEPFWDTSLHYLGFTSEQKGKFSYFINLRKYAETNALMSFSFGEYSKQTEQMSDAEIIADVMTNLRAIYGAGIPEPTGFLRTRWFSNPYSFGSYSFATSGVRSSEFTKFETSLEDKLFFAGEHTSRDYRGTVHGAYLSGIRAAEQIAALL
ncbi:MAG: NAD(P)/FAD-dependent oxidoreductase [Bacteroidota bacterium]